MLIVVLLGELVVIRACHALYRSLLPHSRDVTMLGVNRVGALATRQLVHESFPDSGKLLFSPAGHSVFIGRASLVPML